MYLLVCVSLYLGPSDTIPIAERCAPMWDPPVDVLCSIANECATGTVDDIPTLWLEFEMDPARSMVVVERSTTQLRTPYICHTLSPHSRMA